MWKYSWQIQNSSAERVQKIHIPEQRELPPLCFAKVTWPKWIFNHLGSVWEGSGHCRSRSAGPWVILVFLHWTVQHTESLGLGLVFFSPGWGRWAHALKHQRQGLITKKKEMEMKNNPGLDGVHCSLLNCAGSGGVWLEFCAPGRMIPGNSSRGRCWEWGMMRMRSRCCCGKAKWEYFITLPWFVRERDHGAPGWKMMAQISQICGLKAPGSQVMAPTLTCGAQGTRITNHSTASDLWVKGTRSTNDGTKFPAKKSKFAFCGPWIFWIWILFLLALVWTGTFCKPYFYTHSYACKPNLNTANQKLNISSTCGGLKIPQHRKAKVLRDIPHLEDINWV